MKPRSRSLTVRRTVAAAAPLALASLAATALPAAAVAPGDPAGNNGTVKIVGGEPDGITQDACTFDIEWYGFDEGPDVVSRVEFAVKHYEGGGLGGPSVAGPAEVFVGGDPASGAGTDTGFDGLATYTVTYDGPTHPQGVHVKVTVHTPGSQGADVKHKVLWVKPCAETPPPPSEF